MTDEPLRPPTLDDIFGTLLDILVELRTANGKCDDFGCESCGPNKGHYEVKN